MKTYYGDKSLTSIGGQNVFVADGPKTYLLKHHVRHSPDGFQWGYGGSGPADLALAILTDCIGKELADSYYQAFKWEYVATWGDVFIIEEGVIKDWLTQEMGKK